MPSLLIILVCLIVLLCTGTYLQYGTTPNQRHKFSFEAVIPTSPLSPPEDAFVSYKLPTVPATSIDEPCSKVDFQWLAGDRSFWDGWSSKAIFMKGNGQFTRKNVRSQVGESVCITVLLGPIPAVSSIKVMSHYAPSDTIIMTAKGETSGSHIPITLKQHPKQSNAYFASVQFDYADKYTLHTSVDYRSYFWEFPQLHRYLPNRFLSRNQLNVVPSTLETKPEKLECNLAQNPFALRNSAWMDKQYAPETHRFINPESDHLVFVPNCELKPSRSNPLDLTVHAWGDIHLRRNIEFSKGDLSGTDVCHQREEKIDVFDPISVENGQVYYGEINAIIADSVDVYKRHIDGLTKKLPQADVVVIGVGNNDVAAARQSPNAFAASFNKLLHYLLDHVYTNGEKIVLKTTQYYGSYGPDQGWNHGRSEAYANIIRYTLLDLSPQDRQRVFLWDVNEVGVSEISGECQQKYLSSYHLLQIEDAMLENLFQHIF